MQKVKHERYISIQAKIFVRYACIASSCGMAFWTINQSAYAQDTTATETHLEHQIVVLPTRGLSNYALLSCEDDDENCLTELFTMTGTDWTYLHAESPYLNSKVAFMVESDDLETLRTGALGERLLLVIDTFSDTATVPIGYELIGVRQSQITVATYQDNPATGWNSTETLRAIAANEIPNVGLVHNSLAIHQNAATYVINEVTGASAGMIAESLDDFSTGAAGYNEMASKISMNEGDIAFALRPSQLTTDSSSTSNLSTSALEKNGVPLAIRTAVFGLSNDWPSAISTLKELAQASDDTR